MSIRYQVLGLPGRDNALFVEVDTGQAIHRLLFDCGDGCLSNLSIAQIQNIDAVFFSHFHIDHIAGFDTFLRCNYSRDTEPIGIFGPKGTTDIMHHRLQGVTWNLVNDLPGEFRVHEIDSDRVSIHRFVTSERFSKRHAISINAFEKVVVDTADFRVDVFLLDHGVPSAAYVVREAERINIDAGMLETLGLRSGPWMKSLKDPSAHDNNEIMVDGTQLRVGDLREQLLHSSPGNSIAYLTDFRLDARTEDDLAAFLEDCQIVVCENNFANADRELAERSFHMVSDDVLALPAASSRRSLFYFTFRIATLAINGSTNSLKCERCFQTQSFPKNGGYVRLHVTLLGKSVTSIAHRRGIYPSCAPNLILVT